VNRPCHRALLLAALLVLAGCSSTTFLYNRAGFLIPWYLGDYVNLNRSQKDSLKEMLGPFLQWHRREELPLYVALLEDVEASLDAPPSAEWVEDVANEFVVAWERIERRALEWMISLGEQLSDDQVEEFLANLHDKQDEYEEEYLPRTDSEYVEEAYERLLDPVQGYLGQLDWGQRSILEEAAGELIRSDRAWLSERANWMSRLETWLQREPGWQDGLRESLARRDETYSPEYTRIARHNGKVIYTAIADVLKTRTEKQDRRLRERLDDLRDDLETLIQQ